ncbi:MAG: hypothetical protein AB8B72_11330 [Crocinitomicaceae bacterium]
MIGFDFPKIQFELFGLELLEPMAIITDTIMGGLSMFFGIRIRALKKQLPFYRLWVFFFISFGIGAILGGIGHTFYNQFGLMGKIPSWLFGPVSIYFAERAMISMHWKDSVKKKMYKIFNIKMAIVYLVFFYLLLFVENPTNANLPFLPIAINTIIGMLSTVGLLGFKFTQKISVKFKYFWLGVMIMFPSAILYLFKVNVHQWFDKNDFSHVLISIGLVYWYLGLTKLSEGLKPERL